VRVSELRDGATHRNASSLGRKIDPLDPRIVLTKIDFAIQLIERGLSILQNERALRGGEPNGVAIGEGVALDVHRRDRQR
jgi:hypothetical protein